MTGNAERAHPAPAPARSSSGVGGGAGAISFRTIISSGSGGRRREEWGRRRRLRATGSATRRKRPASLSSSSSSSLVVFVAIVLALSFSNRAPRSLGFAFVRPSAPFPGRAAVPAAASSSSSLSRGFGRPLAGCGDLPARTSTAVASPAPFAAAATASTAMTTTQLRFFRRKQRPEDDTTDDVEEQTVADKTESEKSVNLDERNVGEDESESSSSRSTGLRSLANRFFASEVKREVKADAAASSAVVDDDADSPVKAAKRLRAQAERIRLEAERMDAEFTLQKIAKLEAQIAAKKKKRKSLSGGGEKGGVDKGDDDDDNLRRQLESLQMKLRKDSETVPAAATASSESTDESPPLATAVSSARPLDDEQIQALEGAPGFMKKALASLLDMQYTDEVNLTELALRMENKGGKPSEPPAFTSDQIEERVRQLQKDNNAYLEVLEAAPSSYNETQLALLTLEYEYSQKQQEMDKLVEDLQLVEEEWSIQPVGSSLDDLLNRSAVDETVETLYPKCTRIFDDETMQPLPTLAQVQQLCETILPKVDFSTTSKPEAVSGGYIVRGRLTSKAQSGDDLVRDIQARLDASPSLKGKLTVLYTDDFTVFSDPDAFETYDPEDIPPILYVLGPDITPKPQRLVLVITTALGLATSWYLSIYPFLLNPAINKRVEEELAVASALTSSSSSPPDLSWLSELSVPLFTSFIAIQLIHEAGHYATGAANRVKLSIPTWIPSIITGITSSVTTFKQLPQNKQAMFDIAVAGPLLGMLASIVAIAIGSQLTLSSDPTLLPALPLEILRQSTLGGGIINGILGNGALSLPEGAVGTAAVAGITIPLHPVAVAGYISLVVNSLAMLPVGSKRTHIDAFGHHLSLFCSVFLNFFFLVLLRTATDGGRAALAIFGRGAKLLIGSKYCSMLLIGCFVLNTRGRT